MAQFQKCVKKQISSHKHLTNFGSKQCNIKPQSLTILFKLIKTLALSILFLKSIEVSMMVGAGIRVVEASHAVDIASWGADFSITCGFNDPAILTGVYQSASDAYLLPDGSTVTKPDCSGFADYNLDSLPTAMVPDSLPDEQFVTFTFQGTDGGPINLRSALIVTDESLMGTGCDLYFEVDDGLPVADTLNSVGQSGEGGLFNMNVTTNSFKVAKQEGAICSPYFAIVEVQLYTHPVLTVDRDTNMPCNSCSVLAPGSETDYMTPIQKGSYFKQATDPNVPQSTGLLLTHDPSKDNKEYKVRLGQLSIITNVFIHQSTGVNAGEKLKVRVYLPDGGIDLEYQLIGENFQNKTGLYQAYSGQIIANTISISSSIDMPPISLNKLVVLGSSCSQSDLRLDQLHTLAVDPTSIDLTPMLLAPGQTVIDINNPSFTICLGTVPISRFISKNRYYFETDFVQAIYTYADRSQLEIHLKPEAFYVYSGMQKKFEMFSYFGTLVYENKRTTPNSGDFFVKIFEFENIGEKICQNAKFNRPIFDFNGITWSDSTIQQMTIEAFQEPNIVALPTGLLDDRTPILQQENFFQSDKCGEISYSLLKGDSVVVEQQPEPNSNLFEFRYDGDFLESTFDIILAITFTMDPFFGSTVIRHEYKSVVTVLGCYVETLNSEAPLDQVTLVQTIPSFLFVEMPKFELEPSCNKSEADLKYEYMGGVDLVGDPLNSIPDWIKFDETKRQLTLTPFDKEFHGKRLTLFFGAYLESQDDFGENFEIQIIFASEKRQILQPLKLSEKEQDNYQAENKQVPIILPEPSFDGWKVLIKQSNSIFPDKKDSKATFLKEPTPPEAIIGKINVEGSAQIIFSEPVFEYENFDLKSLTLADNAVIDLFKKLGGKIVAPKKVIKDQREEKKEEKKIILDETNIWDAPPSSIAEIFANTTGSENQNQDQTLDMEGGNVEIQQNQETNETNSSIITQQKDSIQIEQEQKSGAIIPNEWNLPPPSNVPLEQDMQSSQTSSNEQESDTFEFSNGGTGRLLQYKTIVKNESETKFIEVQIIPGINSNPNKLGFDYQVYFVDSVTLEVEIIFENPQYVSAYQPEDELLIKFNGPFFDKEDGLELAFQSREIRKTLPPQTIPGLATDTIQATGETLQVTSTSFLATNAMVNFLLAGSLNQVWGMINNLQIIIHSPLINLQFPGNAFLVYDVMIQVATFDFLPTDDLYPYIFTQFAESEAYSSKFDRLGYSHQFIVMNMGTMLLFLVWDFVLYLIYPFLLCFKQRNKIANKMHQKLKYSLFWASPILFLQEAYLDLAISGFINLFIVWEPQNWSTWQLYFTNITTILLLVGALVLPLFVLVYIWPHYSKLGSKKYEFADRYGPIFEMLDLKNKPAALWWSLLFFVRRILFAIGVIFMQDFPVIQIYLFILPTMAVLICLGQVQPLPSLIENRLELSNSFQILLISYCLLTFTKFVDDAGVRYNMGYAIVCLTCLNILYNLVYIVKDPLYRVKIRIKRCFVGCCKRKNKKEGSKQSKYSLKKIDNSGAQKKQKEDKLVQKTQMKRLSRNLAKQNSSSLFVSSNSEAAAIRSSDSSFMSESDHSSNQQFDLNKTQRGTTEWLDDYRTDHAKKKRQIQRLNQRALEELDKIQELKEIAMKEEQNDHNLGIVDEKEPWKNPKLNKYTLPDMSDLFEPEFYRKRAILRSKKRAQALYTQFEQQDQPRNEPSKEDYASNYSSNDSLTTANRTINQQKTSQIQKLKTQNIHREKSKQEKQKEAQKKILLAWNAASAIQKEQQKQAKYKVKQIKDWEQDQQSETELHQRVDSSGNGDIENNNLSNPGQIQKDNYQFVKYQNVKDQKREIFSLGSQFKTNYDNFGKKYDDLSLRQTKKMPDGQTVLFPDLYKTMTQPQIEMQYKISLIKGTQMIKKQSLQVQKMNYKQLSNPNFGKYQTPKQQQKSHLNSIREKDSDTKTYDLDQKNESTKLNSSSLLQNPKDVLREQIISKFDKIAKIKSYQQFNQGPDLRVQKNNIISSKPVKDKGYTINNIELEFDQKQSKKQKKDGSIRGLKKKTTAQKTRKRIQAFEKESLELHLDQSKPNLSSQSPNSKTNSSFDSKYDHSSSSSQSSYAKDQQQEGRYLKNLQEKRVNLLKMIDNLNAKEDLEARNDNYYDNVDKNTSQNESISFPDFANSRLLRHKEENKNDDVENLHDEIVFTSSYQDTVGDLAQTEQLPQRMASSEMSPTKKKKYRK